MGTFVYEQILIKSLIDVKIWQNIVLLLLEMLVTIVHNQITNA